MNERLSNEQENFNAGIILRNLFSGKIYSALAATQLKREFDRSNLTTEAVFDRLGKQHAFFRDSDFPLTNRQKVRWDDTVICLESMYEIPEENRISNNRLVPVGTSWPGMSLEDISF
jgi:hypothetical protein